MGCSEQASFKPLGITIAVAKDRAIESLMQVRTISENTIICVGNYISLLGAL